jgi:hypothetical protein
VEDQLGSLGLMLNAELLWTTRYFRTVDVFAGGAEGS